MKRNLITAAVFALLIAGWLLSGALTDSPDEAVANTALTPPTESELFRVRVRTLVAEDRLLSRQLRGRTMSKHATDVSAEVTGRVIAVPVARGDRVRTGTLLCELAVDDREAAVLEAETTLKQSELEYQGALRLQREQLLSATRIAELAANLETARANLLRQQLNLERTQITAPFDGVVETLHLDPGDFATPGSPCVTLLDLDPLLVVANVSERDIALIQPGNTVSAITSNDQLLTGTVTFVSNRADTQTRTYEVEVTVPNPDYAVRAGLTTTVRVDAASVRAHRVSPALLTLDDAGVIGLRAVDDSRRVVFHPITIIEDTPEGVWVTGLPERVDLITAGHEFVSAGQRVAVEMSDGEASNS